MHNRKAPPPSSSPSRRSLIERQLGSGGGGGGGGGGSDRRATTRRGSSPIQRRRHHWLLVASLTIGVVLLESAYETKLRAARYADDSVVEEEEEESESPSDDEEGEGARRRGGGIGFGRLKRFGLTERFGSSPPRATGKNERNAQRRRPSRAVAASESGRAAVVAAGGPIRRIAILGERNSGTRWTYGHLGACFNHTIPVDRRLTRYKHWFQYEDEETNIVNGTLVVAQFRNPFEWVEAMRKVPHHASSHVNLDWKTFVTKPWTTARVGLDLNMTDNEKTERRGCQENFDYRDIVTCHKKPHPKGFYGRKSFYSEHQPFYEMKNDGSGEPFENILEFRAAKIRNMASEVRGYKGVHAVWSVQYEFLLRRGTESLIRRVEREMGVKANCTPVPPQPDRPVRKLDPEFVRYLREQIDWDAERLAGYGKPPPGDELQ